MAKGKGDPCWDNYEMAGMKMKNGKKVPNCIPSGKAASAKSKAQAYKAGKKK